MGLANAFGGRVARGLGAVVLADLITGLAAYSVISLAGLWLFSVTWIHVAALAATRGMALGTPVQLGLAWVGAFVTLPLAGGVISRRPSSLRAAARSSEDRREADPPRPPVESVPVVAPLHHRRTGARRSQTDSSISPAWGVPASPSATVPRISRWRATSFSVC